MCKPWSVCLRVIAWRQVALCNQAQLCKQLCAIQSKEIQCNFVLLFFSLVARRLSSYFYSSMEVVFRCLLKKNKIKQSRHGRKELLREGKKGGGEEKYSHSLQIRLMKNTKIARSWEREREREINGPQKRMHHMVPAPNKGKTKNPNMTKKTHLRQHDGVVYKSTWKCSETLGADSTRIKKKSSDPSWSWTPLWDPNVGKTCQLLMIGPDRSHAGNHNQPLTQNAHKATWNKHVSTETYS